MQNAWHKKANWNDKRKPFQENFALMHSSYAAILLWNLSAALMLKLGQQTPHYYIALWQWRFLFRQLKLSIMAYIGSMAWHRIAQQTHNHITRFLGGKPVRGHMHRIYYSMTGLECCFSHVSSSVCAHLSLYSIAAAPPKMYWLSLFLLSEGLILLWQFQRVVVVVW